ncbi:integrase core domain-containing protein [Streptomyces sp. NPDC055239]
MLLRLACLTVTNLFATLRLLTMSDRDKDADRIKFAPKDRALLATLLAPLPRHTLRRLRLLIRPDSVLRRHRDLIKRRHAHTCRPKRPGRPPTVRSIRVLILRLVRENPSWGYRRVHGELATLGIQVAASTVWEILTSEGVDPAPDRAATTWADSLRSQADALMACDFIETVTLTGQRQYILTVIEHATRRIRILSTTAHPTAAWVSQAARNLAMELTEANATLAYLVRDRDARYPALFDDILSEVGIQVVRTGIRIPRVNAITERLVQTCRPELLDRTLVWNERHLRHALRQFELHYNTHRPHQATDQAAPLRATPEPLTPTQITYLDVRRRDRLGGILHEYQHAA